MTEKKRAMLAPDIILKTMLNSDEHIEKLIEPNNNLHLVVSDFGLYEAIMCLNPDDNINWVNFMMLMRKCELVLSGINIEMHNERKEHLREVALGK